MKNNLDPSDTSTRLKRRPLRHLNEFQKGINISFEYFPAKNQFSANQLRHTSRILSRLNPRFVSVTYGAGGSEETECFKTLNLLRKASPQPVAAHITHSRTDKDEIDALVERIAMLGISRIVALRGDNQSGDLDRNHYPSTIEMVEGLKQIYDFDISVAGYPETHPDAISSAADIDYLKRKVDAGANRILCQFCFDSNRFLNFRDKAVKAGISIPIIPGILPVHDFAKVKAFATKCGATIPTSIEQLFSDLPNNREVFQTVSATITAEFCTRLIDNGITDFHFYTLNRHNLVRSVCHILGIPEIVDEVTASIEKIAKQQSGRALTI